MVVKIDQFLLLGMGSIMRSLMELLHHEKHQFLKCKMVCICPEEIPQYIYKIKPDIKHIKKYITESNYEKLLKPFMIPNCFVIDLTVNTDSIALIKLCASNNVNYINTSIEEYIKPNKQKNKEKLTLYYQDIQLQKQTKNIKNDTTQLHSMGLNPGAISSLVMKAIYEYCKKYKPEKLALLKDGKWGLVCKDILEIIHISEYDNQEIQQQFNKNIFRNSWSCLGFMSEALSPSFVASDKPLLHYKKSKYNNHIYYSDKMRSMDVFAKSICLDPNGEPFEIFGRCITHFEVVSLSQKLGYGKYTPKISYVYNSCPISNKGLESIKESNYKEPPKSEVFFQHDIINKSSFDSMGALLQFRDGRRWWCGTVLDNNEVMRILGKNCKSNATQLQVSIAVLAGVEWIMKHRNEDLITAEEIPYDSIINRCIPYFGKFFCKEI